MRKNRGSLYRVTKPIEWNKKKYMPDGKTFIRLSGRDAEIFRNSGCVDDIDKRGSKKQIVHDLDKRRL